MATTHSRKESSVKCQNDLIYFRIGERATLVSSAGARSYGVMMNISSDQAKELYSDKSVADYLPESVIVELLIPAERPLLALPARVQTKSNRVLAILKSAVIKQPVLNRRDLFECGMKRIALLPEYRAGPPNPVVVE